MSNSKLITYLVSATVVGLSIGVYLAFPSSLKAPQSKSITVAKGYESDHELQALLSMPNSVERDSKFERYFTEKMRTQPLETLEVIVQTERREHREVFYRFALDAWYKLDSSAVFSWLSSNNPSADLAIALHALIKKTNTPTHMLAFADALTPSLVRAENLMALMEEWIIKNPKDILSWSIERKDSEIWISQAFKVMTQQDIATAIRSSSYLVAHNRSALQTSTQAIIDNYRFATVGAEALFALDKLAPYPLKEELVGALLPLLASDENIALANINKLVSSLSPGSFQDSLHEMLALNWAKKNPLEAAGYAESLGGETRKLALKAVVTTWVEDDLESADEWLKGVTGNIDLAAVTIGLGSARLGNIQVSDEWLGRIKDSELRTKAVIDVIKMYYERSPEAGVYHLVFQKELSKRQKLDILQEMYPKESFTDPMQALDELGRLENLNNRVVQ